MLKTRKNLIIASGLMFVFFAVLSYLFPYINDDWIWGAQRGFDRIKTGFADYNGRYAGNLLGILLTRNKLLDALVMATTYVMCCLFAVRYAEGKNNTGIFIFATFIFLTMPKAIFAQTVVWTSGFANYMVSALISIIYISISKNVFGSDAPSYSKKMTIVAFLLGFVGALFMENVTLFNVLLGAFMVVYCHVKFKKRYGIHYGFLTGACLGAVVMFLNTGYTNVADGTDTYRNVASGFKGILYTVFDHAFTIVQNLILANYIMCIAATVLVVIMTYRAIKTVKSKKIVIASAVVNVLCLASFFAFRIYWMLFTVYPLVMLVMIISTFLYVVSLVISIWLCVDGEEKVKILFPLLCAPVLSAPFLVINPLTARCVLPSYIFLMVFVTALFAYVMRDKNMKKVTIALSAGIGVLAAMYFSIFIPIHTVDTARSEFAKYQSEQGEKEILICPLPNEEYLWGCEPVVIGRIDREKTYKQFYGLKEDVTFKFVTQEELFSAIENK